MPISPNEKFAEELQKMVRVDVLFDNHQLPDDLDEDEDDDE